jgi:hypothetical protein
VSEDQKNIEIISRKDSWKPGKTVVKSLGLMGFSTGCQISAIDVKDGKIVRIRPLHM